MTHFKVYIKSEKLYTVAPFSESDQKYYVPGCNCHYIPDQVIRMEEVKLDKTVCNYCIINSDDYLCINCMNFINFKPLKTK